MKKKIYEMLRKHVARIATCNLGKVEITDDEIICYVDGKKLKKKLYNKSINRYDIMLKCVPPKEEIYRTYNVDKPVHYIIKGVDFDKQIEIMSSMKNCHVTFENCKFKTFVGISFGDHITFKNNIYEVNDCRYYYSIIPYGEFHMSTRINMCEVNKLEFINDKIMVDDIEEKRAIRASEVSKELKNNTYKKGIIEMWLYAKEIDFINSDTINVESLELKAEKLIMENSNLDVKGLSIYTDDITSNNSMINTNIGEINCENDAISQIQDIDISYNNLYVNGIEVNKNDDINKDNLELQQKRLELISILNRIGAKCEEQISEEIRNQPVKRVLKK